MQMWQVKVFKTKDDMNKWIEKHKNSYQWYEIFINNGYGIEYRKLRKI